jgi:hypothetical protein
MKFIPDETISLTTDKSAEARRLVTPLLPIQYHLLLETHPCPVQILLELIFKSN